MNYYHISELIRAEGVVVLFLSSLSIMNIDLVHIALPYFSSARQTITIIAVKRQGEFSKRRHLLSLILGSRCRFSTVGPV